MGSIKEFDNHITFVEETHQYFRASDHMEFTSVSRVLSKFKIPFDKEGVSKRMTSSKEEQQDLLNEWASINKKSTDHGHMIHSEAENLIKFGSVKNREFAKLEQKLFKYLRMYKRNFSELICYDDSRFVAGMSDWPALRNTTGNYYILDINDFKTNLRKGIVNYSGKFDEILGVIKYYNKFLLSPVEYMEESNYNEYCLQLSIYAFLFELMWDRVKIGSLNLFYISEDLEVTKIPVPYLRPQAIAILDRFCTMKDIKTDKLINRSYEQSQDSRGKAMLEYSDETTLSLLGNDPDGGDSSSDEEYE